MDDISSLFKTATSTPQEAAEHIQNATMFGTTPVSDPDANAPMSIARTEEQAPKETEPGVTQFATQSEPHAALIKNNVPQLNYVDRLAKYFGDQFNDVQPASQKAASLAFKQMQNGGTLNDQDKMDLWQTNQDLKGFAERNYDLDGPERPQRDWFDTITNPSYDLEGIAKGTAKFAADAAAGIANFPRSFAKGALDALNDETLPDGGAHPIRALIAKAAFGGLGIRDFVGANYNQLSHATHDDGTPVNMDETTKKHIAWGAGAVYSAGMALVPELADSVMPMLSRTMTPKFVAMAMQAPEHAALRIAIGNIGKSAAIMGAMNMTNEATNIVTEEMAKNYNGTETSLVGSLVSAGEKLAANQDQYAARLGKAGVVGGLSGAAMGLGGNAIGYKGIQAQVESIAQQGEEFLRGVTVTRNSSPAGLIEGEAPPRPEFKPGKPPPETPPEEPKAGPRPGFKDVTPIRPNVGDEVPFEQTVKPAVNSLQFHEGLHNINDTLNTTEMSDIAPAERASFVKTVFDRAGITKLYTSMGNLKAWATSEEKGAKARQFFGLDNIKAAKSDSIISVDPVKVMDIAKDDPSILDHMSPKPQIPTAISAKVHLEGWTKKESARADLFNKLGIKPGDTEDQGIDAYHGTTSDFKDFNVDKAGSGNDGGYFGKGLYFARDPEHASGYTRGDGGNVRPVKLDLKNPFKWEITKGKQETTDDTKAGKSSYSANVFSLVTQGKKLPPEIHDAVLKRAGITEEELQASTTDADYKKYVEKREKSDKIIEYDQKALDAKHKQLTEKINRAVTEELKARGHDGVVVDLHKATGSYREYVVFDSKQVRSKFETKKAESSNVEKLPEKGKPKAEAKPYDFEDATRRVSNNLEANKRFEAEIQAAKDAQNFEETWDKSKGVVSIDGKSEKMSREKFISMKQGMIDINNERNAKIKQEVIDATKKQPPGKVLFGHWPEPGMEDTVKTVGNYLNVPTFTDAVRQVIPKADLSKIEASQQAARENRVSNIMEAAHYEMDKVHDIHTEEMKEARLIEAFEQLANDPHLAITEKFRNSRNAKNKSLFQIDPGSLTKEQVEFADMNKSRYKGVFAKKGGQPLEDIAQLLGAQNGDELLKIFATTPTREEMAKARAGLQSLVDAAEIRKNDDLHHSKIIENLRNEAANHLAELHFLLEQEWPGFKAAIKTVAYGVTNLPALESQVKSLVGNMEIGELNPRQYQMGRVKSHRLAIKAILDQDIAKAGMHLENSAFNAMMEKEIRLQTALANRRLKFARTFTRSEVMDVLKEAGKPSVEAAKEILDLWKLSTPFKDTSARGAYRKWMTQKLNSGAGDFSIPREISDLRESPQKMTVNQLMVVHDRLNMVLQEAKRENRLNAAQEQDDKNRAELEMGRVEAKFEAKAKAHPAYDESRLKPASGNRTFLQSFFLKMAGVEALFAAKQNIIREADFGNLGGEFFEMLDSEFSGSGKHYEKMGFTLEKKFNKEREAYIQALKERHNGGKPGMFNVTGMAIDRAEQKFIEVPELKGTGYAKLTKADIMSAYSFMGTELGRRRLIENNGVSQELWQKIFDDHLTVADVEYVHGVFDWYDKRRPEMQKLQDMQGREVEWVEGIPITHKGVQRMGGYRRITYENEYVARDVKLAEDYFENKDAAFYDKGDGAKWGRQWVGEATKQGHYITRVQDYDKPVSLSFLKLHEGMAEIDHDLAYRIPVTNFFKLMSRPKIVKALTALLGEPKVKALIQTNLEIAGRPATRDEGWFTDGNRIIKSMMNKLGNTYTIQTLWGNTHTMLRQFESTFEMFHALGPKGVFHGLNVARLILQRLDHFPALVNWAREVDPSIEKYISATSDAAVDSVMKLVPKKGGGAISDPLKNAGEMGKSAGFFPIQMIDMFLKTFQAATVARTALAGHIPGLSLDDLAKMTDEQKTQKIQTIIQQASTLTQIQNRSDLKAQVQKHWATKLSTLFWNYQRNILNNIFLDTKRVKWNIQIGLENRKNAKSSLTEVPTGGGSGGNGKGPTRFDEMRDGGEGRKSKFEHQGGFKAATGIGLQRMAVSMMSLMFMAWVSNKAYKTTRRRINNMEDLAEEGKDWIEHLMLSPAEQVADTLPDVKDIKRAVENTRKYSMSEVQIPFTQALTSIATCWNDMHNVMSLSRMPSRMQVIACLKAEGYMPYGIPLPVAGVDQFMRYLEQKPRYATGGLQMGKVAEMSHEMKDFATNPPANVDPKYVAGIAHLQTQVAPEAVEIPKGTDDAIKLAMSNNDWHAPNGIYGFSSDQWKSIQKEAPELRLTENGRISKDTEQQEKAMQFELEKNAHALDEKGLPVTTSTLFGAHKLGLETYEKLYHAAADDKLKTTLPELAKNPEFAGFKTVGQAKGYLTKKLDQGKPATDNAQLTPVTQNVKD